MTILEVEDLVKVYRSKKGQVTAVRGISFSVDEGEVIAFLGPNGAGKSTTIKAIAGLIEPTAGRVRIGGRDPDSDRLAMQEIGAVLEGSRNIYWRLTPEENLEYFGTLRGLSRRRARERGTELLERFGLADRGKSLVRSLSRGMQQKVAIAVAVLHSPRLLLLDEPTLGLDPRSSDSVKELVRELAQEGRAILLTTHQLEVAEEISDRLALLRNGELVLDSAMREVLSSASETPYRIRYEGVLLPEQVEALSHLKIQLERDSILYFGPPARLPRVLDILHPLELISVQRDQRRLTDVFLEMAYEQRNAQHSAG